MTTPATTNATSGRNHPNPTTSVLAFFGTELARLRETAHLTHHQLAHRIHYSRSLIAMIETARRVPTHAFAQACDTALNSNGLLTRLWPLVDHIGYAAVPPPYTDLEATAAAIRTYHPHLIPDLLQTHDYAHTLWATRIGTHHPTLNHHLQALKERQHTILNRPEPPHLSVLLDEAALRHTFSAPEMMRDQLTHLLDRSHDPRITVVALPLHAPARALLDGTLHILTFIDGPDAAHTTHPLTTTDTIHHRALLDRAYAEALTPTATRDLLTALHTEHRT